MKDLRLNWSMFDFCVYSSGVSKEAVQAQIEDAKSTERGKEAMTMGRKFFDKFLSADALQERNITLVLNHSLSK